MNKKHIKKELLLAKSASIAAGKLLTEKKKHNISRIKLSFSS